ncbi:competence protein ComK [Paraliobacillus ryukyuensis]|uniref:competence protein ComK n=1 Tax=Paraliobacillus ryukyuensis TaxID=200904 RepID=UPI0015C4DED7|nr:competence protein ComK [Paraliobacillus ryukyuensis]
MIHNGNEKTDIALIANNYIISPCTLAIVPQRAMTHDTIVYEKDRTIRVKQTPLQIIKASCIEHGATYEGRRQSSCHLLHLTQKVPIVIKEKPMIYTFPSQSPNNFSTSWLFPRHISTITIESNKTNQQTTITFHNKKQIHLQESTYQLKQQCIKTIALHYAIKASSDIIS